jgi:hypothetical protein
LIDEAKRIAFCVLEASFARLNFVVAIVSKFSNFKGEKESYEIYWALFSNPHSDRHVFSFGGVLFSAGVADESRSGSKQLIRDGFVRGTQKPARQSILFALQHIELPGDGLRRGSRGDRKTNGTGVASEFEAGGSSCRIWRIAAATQ